MKKKLLVLLALMMALSMVVMTGCGGEDTDQDNAELTGWEYIEDKGVLVVGLDDTFAPMGFRDEANNLVGFDIGRRTAGYPDRVPPDFLGSKRNGTGIQEHRLHLERYVRNSGTSEIHGFNR